MRRLFLLTKRRFQQTLSEPDVSFVYKAVGFLAMVGFFAAGAASVLLPLSVPLPSTVMFVVSAFGAAVFFAGLVSSEAWALSMRRRYNYTLSLDPYTTRKLAIFVVGLSVVTLAAVLLVLR
ncbi:MAG: hypothetical protein LYZ69_03355 [Nitrososphaerales archaeon]|nr:hypothetical protein [Nitrososphaerales archaeon]